MAVAKEKGFGGGKLGLVDPSLSLCRMVKQQYPTL